MWLQMNKSKIFEVVPLCVFKCKGNANRNQMISIWGALVWRITEQPEDDKPDFYLESTSGRS